MQLTKKCPKYTYRKDGVYYFSKAVPKDLLDFVRGVGACGSHEWKLRELGPAHFQLEIATGNHCQNDLKLNSQLLVEGGQWKLI